MEGFRFADGPYRAYLEAFVSFKQGKGEKGGRNLLAALRKIADVLADEADASGIGEPLARRALERDGDESASTRARRVSIMRQLCAYLTAIGVPCWKVPPRYYTAPRSEFRPYILGDGDIGALLAAVDSLPRSFRHGGRAPVYPVLARLLVSSGLRIGEALALDIGDFDAESGVLSVVNSKNGVSRLVPLSPGMAERLRGHVAGEERDSGPLFMSPHTGAAYSYDGVHYAFERIYGMAGIVNDAGGRPRIHDLRHTFCTRSLDRMLSLGMSVYEAVPVLAAYVGHVNYADTEKYIHLTSTGYEELLAAESGLAHMIPEAVV